MDKIAKWIVCFLVISCQSHIANDFEDENNYEKSQNASAFGTEEYVYKFDHNRRMVKLLWNNGNVYGKGFYYGKQRVGKWTEYFENGKINKEFFFKDGKIDSIYTIYYPNGIIKSRENYSKGQKLESGEYFDSFGHPINLRQQ